jgi:hypothetical protein
MIISSYFWKEVRGSISESPAYEPGVVTSTPSVGNMRRICVDTMINPGLLRVAFVCMAVPSQVQMRTTILHKLPE